MKKRLIMFPLIMMLTILIAVFAISASAATDEDITVIVVGETMNEETGAAYTLDEAWEKQAEVGVDNVEVVVKASNDDFATQFSNVNKGNKKATIQLTGDVTVTSRQTPVKNANITIDVSGHTLTVTSNYFNISNHNVTLTFRASSADGNVVGNNQYYGVVNMDLAVSEESTVNYVSTGSAKLKVSGTHYAVGFKNSMAGVANIHFDGVDIATTKTVINLNASPTAKPATVKIEAKNSNFTVTSGSSVIGLATADDKNGGCFGMESTMHFTRCTFNGNDTTKARFVQSNSLLKGRYYGTLDFTNCKFSKINLNVIGLMSKVTQNSDGSFATGDYEYPYLSESGTVSTTSNCTYDYRDEVIAANYNFAQQIRFIGNTHFDACQTSIFNSKGDGFATSLSNFVKPTSEYFWIPNEDRSYVLLSDGRVENADDFFYFTHTLTATNPLTLVLTEDVSLSWASTKYKIAQNRDISLNLNGHTLSMEQTSGARFTVLGKLHIYSSSVGGKLISIAAPASTFVLDSTSSPMILFGREEDARENLTIESTRALVSGVSTFAGPEATIGVYSANVKVTAALVKMNAKATAAVKPAIKITLQNCEIDIASKGLISYNENEVLNSDTKDNNNGIIGLGSTLVVDGCTILDKDGGNVSLFTSYDTAREEGGEVMPNFQGRYYGTVTFKNTHFEKVNLNFDEIYSTADNKALNGANRDYDVSGWDVTKQVTFLEGCTFNVENTDCFDTENNTLYFVENVIFEGDCHFRKVDGTASYVLTPYGFVSTYLNLASDLNMIYRVFLPKDSDATVTFLIDGFKSTVEPMGTDENGLYLFKLAGITPAKMNKAITATLNVLGEEFDVCDGVTIRKYIDGVKKNYSADEKMMALADSLLVYGAAAQQYVDGNTEGFDEDTVGALSNLASINSKENVDTGSQTALKYFALSLDGAFSLRAGIVLADTADVTLEVTKNGETTIYSVSQFAAQGGIISIPVADIYATELDTEITLVLKRAGETVDALVVDANAYLYRASSNSAMEEANPGISALAKAIYAYGVAAKAYVA